MPVMSAMPDLYKQPNSQFWPVVNNQIHFLEDDDLT